MLVLIFKTTGVFQPPTPKILESDMKSKSILALSAIGLLAGCGMDPYHHDDSHHNYSNPPYGSGGISNSRNNNGSFRTDGSINNINNVSGVMPSKGNPSKL